MAWRALVGVALLVLWQTCATVLGPIYVSRPAAVVARTAGWATSGGLLRDAIATATIAAAGLLLGSVIGVAAALTLSLAPRVRLALGVYLDASAGVPKYALAPVFILWFGIGSAPKLLLVVLLVVYPMFYTASAGLRDLDAQLLRILRVLGAGRRDVVRHAVWPSILPFLLSGLRISVPRAISGTILGELLVGDDGIGRFIDASRQSLDSSGVFAGAALAAAMVFAANAASGRVATRSLAWQEAVAPRGAALPGNDR